MKRKLQVFVSSTFTDLKVERQAAVEAILKSGHIPAGMELFTAGNKSQMKTIERWIDESDVYMLILGGRYGSLEPTKLLSYTELEYDYAISSAKPLFSVPIAEDALEEKIRAYGSEFMENDNQQLLKRFREKILSKTSSFFRDTKDIKLCVHESLSEYASDPLLSLKGWVSGSDIPDIKSLQDEIAQLRSENANLKRRAEESIKNTALPRNVNFDELTEILRATEVTVPADIANGKELKTDLLSIVQTSKEYLITGVSNRSDGSPSAKFYFFKVLPKLQTHGLADNEKVTGALYRRSFLNKQGCAFVAEMERRLVRSKQSAIVAAEPPPARQKAAPRRSTVKNNK